MEVFLIVILGLLIIWLFSRTSGLAEKVDQFESRLSQLTHSVRQIEKQIKELKAELWTPRQESPPAVEISPEAPVSSKVPLTSQQHPLAPAPPATVQAARVPPLEPLVPQKPKIDAGTARPERAGPAAPPAKVQAPPAYSPPQPPFHRPPQKQRFDWEGLIGVKVFSWISGIALLIAAIYFLAYSMDRGWLQPPVRMAIGVLVGLALLVLCEVKAARKYPVTANAMDAAAVAILFATFFAAHALWNLIGGALSFVFLVLVAVVAVLLSIRRDSLFIALLGLVGGFATPALLSTGENRPIGLFSYLLLLNAGLAWIAVKKRWPLLTTLSLILTTLYQWGWVGKFLTEGQLPLAVGIFLVFPILTFVALTLGRRSEEDRGWVSLYGRTIELSSLLPVMFAAYLASVSGYGNHYLVLFGFLLLLDAGLLAIAAARGHEFLHLAGAISTLVIFAIWFSRSYVSSAWPAILACLGLFVLFYLTSPFIASKLHGQFTDLGHTAVFAAPLLLAGFAVLIIIEPSCAAPGLIFSVLFALLAASAAFAIYRQEGPIYYLAAFFALVAEAVWSVKYLTPERLVSGLAIYGAFGLFYIGTPMLARRLRKTLRPEQGGVMLLFASVALLFFIAHDGVAVWGLALLLLILNIGLLLEGSASRFPHLSTAGIILSWIVLAYFWYHATLAEILIPALAVVTAFAFLVLFGMIWLQKKTGADAPAFLGNGAFLGLVGHLFLFFVASQRALAIPPYPLLGVLFVLDLAIGAAVLYLKRHQLLVGAMAASSFVLIVWVSVVTEAPYPAVAILSAAALALFSVIWLFLARLIGIRSEPFADTAALTIYLAQLVAIFAGTASGAPGVGFLATAHLVFLISLLALAWYGSKHVLATIAVVPAAAAVSLWMVQHAGRDFLGSQLLFAGLVYLMFLLYPLLLGRRTGGSYQPYLAAVLASVPFFFQARYTIMTAGRQDIIGILPVTQAGLMAILLIRLLRLEPAGARVLGRLALIAGSALAFVTVAIPLQLERQWITIGWALEGAALAWLYRKITHRGLLAVSTGLCATVFVRLVWHFMQLPYEPRSAMPIWNWHLYTYLIAALALIVAGWMFAKTKDSLEFGALRASGILPAGGAILLFLLLNIEIADFYSIGDRITFKLSATLAQDLTYTLGWALFAVALLAVGIVISSYAARISSLGLLVITILKCFLHDLARLGGLYRVISFVGLAVCLALVALALQRFVLVAKREAKRT